MPAFRETSTPQDRQPVFTMPLAVSVLVAGLLAIHAAQSLVLDAQGQLELALWFGFIPARLWFADAIPGGFWPLLWTSVTHAFLHAGWEHVLVNAAWLAIFGTPVARRYGPLRFYVAFVVCAVAGAAAFTVGNTQSVQILMGASGGIAGLTGVAIRFIFQPILYTRHPETGEIIVLGRKLASLGEMLRERRARTFFLFWVGLNVLVPFLPLILGGVSIQIAWQAHLGGFFAGLLLAPFLETGPERIEHE